MTVRLADPHDIGTYTFTVLVINRPPDYYVPYTAGYPAISVHLNFKEPISVPAFYDQDGSDCFARIDDTFPTPILFSADPTYTTLTVAPLSFSEVGLHLAYVTLFDLGGAYT